MSDISNDGKDGSKHSGEDQKIRIEQLSDRGRKGHFKKFGDMRRGQMAAHAERNRLAEIEAKRIKNKPPDRSSALERKSQELTRMGRIKEKDSLSKLDGYDINREKQLRDKLARISPKSEIRKYVGRGMDPAKERKLQVGLKYQEAKEAHRRRVRHQELRRKLKKPLR